MENRVASDYIESKDDTSAIPENSPCADFSLSSNAEKNKQKSCCKISRVNKKVVSPERCSSLPHDKDAEKTKRHLTGLKLNVLNKHTAESATQSVQKKTKIIKRNVPDRLGKYVSYRVRPETKLIVRDCKRETKSCKEWSAEDSSSADPSEAMTLFDGCTDTKLASLGNECLSNNEAVSLSNSFESDLDTKNIFENFFDDCLGSTSKEKDASSQGEEGDERARTEREKAETTPVKEKRDAGPPPAPVKIKDHSNYYSSHKNIRHVCAYCQKIFKSNGKLNSHVYSHTGERPFDCNHCGKAFSSKFKLVRHLLIHSEIRKFVCQICDRTFLRNDHLKNHYKVHDPQKKMYKCSKENCDKEYSSLMSHKKHMAYHNVEDGDLKCLICNVKYETKEEILFHLKSHSGSRLFKTQSDKKFKCEFCERLFLTRKDVTRHLVVHTGERDFLCQFCPQRFGRKDHLVRHIKKSHVNENVNVKNDPEVKGPKEEIQKPEEVKQTSRKCSTNDSPPVAPVDPCATKEINTQTEEPKNRTHIVITVQGKGGKNLQNRKRGLQNKTKSFQKEGSVVPKKKQVPFAKSPTTQILLQNIPNILIIPNNSIILLRNQQTPGKGSKKSEEGGSTSAEPEPEPEDAPTLPRDEPDATENFLPGNDTFGFNYDSNMFPPSSQFLGSFPDGDTFGGFQTDLPTFGSQFEAPDSLNLEMLPQNDLLPRSEVGMGTNSMLRSDPLTNGNLLTETSRQIKLLETGMNTMSEKEKDKTEICEDIEKDFFEAGMLNESILNDFKDESSGVMPADNDVGILNTILNQQNDNCGFELLRNLLSNENPVLSPLPGFSQIFHNSNANSS